MERRLWQPRGGFQEVMTTWNKFQKHKLYDHEHWKERIINRLNNFNLNLFFLEKYLENSKLFFKATNHFERGFFFTTDNRSSAHLTPFSRYKYFHCDWKKAKSIFYRNKIVVENSYPKKQSVSFNHWVRNCVVKPFGNCSETHLSKCESVNAVLLIKHEIIYKKK